MEDSAKLGQRQQAKPKKGGGGLGGGGGGGGGMRPKIGPIEDKTIVQYLYKTKMCYHWQSGYCLMGNNCNFAHGVHELRIPRSYTLVNGQEVAVPDNIFNPDVTASKQSYEKPPPKAAQDSESYRKALNDFNKEDSRDEAADLGYDLGSFKEDGDPDKSKVDLLQVEGKLAETILKEEPKSNPDENKKYFQIEGNHDKPFGGDFNGTPMDSRPVKPLKVKIARAVEEQTESVQTPKWAGWLLDTPHDTSSGDRDPTVPRVPEDTCPMCGHREVITRDAGTQCTLLESPK